MMLLMLMKVVLNHMLFIFHASFFSFNSLRLRVRKNGGGVMPKTSPNHVTTWFSWKEFLDKPKKAVTTYISINTSRPKRFILEI